MSPCIPSQIRIHSRNANLYVGEVLEVGAVAAAHLGGELVVEVVAEVVHLEEVAVHAAVRAVVVPRDVRLVLHVDLHAELLLRGRLVDPLVDRLPQVPLLRNDVHEGRGGGRRGHDGQGDGEQEPHVC